MKRKTKTKKKKNEYREYDSFERSRRKKMRSKNSWIYKKDDDEKKDFLL